MLSVRGLALASLGNATGSVVAALCGLGLNVAATRLLGLRLAGTYFESFAIVTILVTACMWGSDVGVSRAIPSGTADRGARSAAEEILAGAVVPVALFGILIIIAAELTAGSISFTLAPHEQGPFAEVFRIMVVAVPLLAVERILTSSLRGLGLTAPTAVVDSVTVPLMRLGIATGFGIWFHSPVDFAVAWTVSAVIGCGWAALWLRHELLRHPSRREGRGGRGKTAAWVDFWRFSSARGLADLVAAAGQWSGVVLVGALASARAAGIYGAVNRVALAGTLALTSANAVLAPRIAHAMAVQSRQGVELLYNMVTSWAVGLGGPVFVILALYPRTVLDVFGRGLSPGQTALIILAAAMLWNLLTGPVTVALLMSGHSRLNLANAVCSVTCLLVCGLLLIPRYSVTGAAISWAVAIVVDNGLALFQISRVLKMKVLARNILGILGVSILTFAGVGASLRLFGLNGLLGLLLEIAVAVPAYITMLHLLRLSDPLIALIRPGRGKSEYDLEEWAQTG